MPIRRGRFAPQNTFLETIAQKFDRGNSNFVLGSAQEKNDYPIVYCSDGFCEITGFSRSELMRRSCTCCFLYGIDTNQEDVENIRKSFKSQIELKKEILFYKKNGSPFWCLLDIVPIKNEKGRVVLFLASHKDITKRKINGETCDKDSGGSTASEEGGRKSNLRRSRSRKFSRDVLFHLSRQYQQANGTKTGSKQSSKPPFKRSRSFSFNKERVPQYKRETTKRSRFLFLHYSHLKGVWDWWILVLTFYIAIMIPYNVAFQRHDRVRDIIIFDMVIELFFILDIVVHFRTTYVDQSGKIVYDQKAIAFKYLKGWFILDFLAALPFEALYFINRSWANSAFDNKSSSFNEGFLVQLLKCGRLLRLFRVVRKLHRYTEYSTILLTLLMLAFTMVAHWLACVWYIIGYEEVNLKSTISWLFELGEKINQPYANFTVLSGPDEGSAYITALYFTLSSMTTVGFGNVSANTNGEKIFSVIVMLIGAVMHAAIFGNVAAIIQKLYANQVRYHSRSNEIKQFIRVHRIEQDLSNRLEDYFHTNWSISGGVDTREILNMFPIELQADVCTHLYRLLLELPVFAQAPRGCLRALSLQIRPMHIGPGDHILMQNDVINAIYFLQTGSVEVLQGESVAAILGKGDLFGEDIARKVPIRRSNGDVRALTYCDVLYITRDRFQEVLQLYQDFTFKFSEKLELTYDLGASERDIWRRGGLDSISEDEEEEDSIEDIVDSALCDTADQLNEFLPDYKKNVVGMPYVRRTNNHFTSESKLMGYLRNANDRRNRIARTESRKCSESKPLLRGDNMAPEDDTGKDFLTVVCGSSPQSSRQTSNQSLDWDHASLGFKPENEDELSTLNEESNLSIHSSLGRSDNKRNDVLEDDKDMLKSSSWIASAPSRSLLGTDDGSLASSSSTSMKSFNEQTSGRQSLCSSSLMKVNELDEKNRLTSNVSDFSSLPFHERRLSPFSVSLSLKENYGRARSKTNETYESYFTGNANFSKQPQGFDNISLQSRKCYNYNQSNASTLSRGCSHGINSARTNKSNSSFKSSCERECLTANGSFASTGSPLTSVKSFEINRSNTANSNCSSSVRRRKTGTLFGSPASSSKFNSSFSKHLHLSCNDSDQDENESVRDSVTDPTSQHENSLRVNEDENDNVFLSSNESAHSKESTQGCRRLKNAPNCYSERYPRLSCSPESSVSPRGRRKVSSAIVPPVFAQLVRNVNNPYSDFVPPMRESAITCSCSETENCEICREQITGSDSEGSSENTKWAEDSGRYNIGNDLNQIHKSSDGERKTDRNLRENETPCIATKHENPMSLGTVNYPGYIREVAKGNTGCDDTYQRSRNHSCTSSISLDQPPYQDCQPESSGLTNSTVDSSLPDFASDETFKPYDLPFPHESFSKASLSSNLSNHRSETKINFEEMEQDVPTRPLRSSFSAPALTLGFLSSFDENEEDLLRDNVNDPTDDQLQEIFEDVTSAKECATRLQRILGSSESITDDITENTNQIVKRLDNQVLILSQEVTSLRSDVKKILNLMSNLKSS